VAAPKTEPPPKLTFAQIGLFIYPAKDQPADQQKKDEDACYDWAEANTGLTLVAGNIDAETAGKAAAKDAGEGRVAGFFCEPVIGAGGVYPAKCRDCRRSRLGRRRPCRSTRSRRQASRRTASGQANQQALTS
jgi:hypothetical protein